MAVYEFITKDNLRKLAKNSTQQVKKAGSEVASTLFRGYKSDGSPLPTVFADEIGWSVYDAAGTTLQAMTKIGDTVISTTEDLIAYIASLPTTGEVTDTLRAKDAMIYKGTIGSGTQTELATTQVGDTYKVAANGWITISPAGVITWSQNKPSTGNYQAVEVGDMVICLTTTPEDDEDPESETVAATWNVIQTNLALTSLTFKKGNTTLFSYDTVQPYNVTFGEAIAASMSDSNTMVIDLPTRTIDSNTLNSVTAGANDTNVISAISFDTYGRVTGYTVTPFKVGPTNLYVTGSTTVVNANTNNITNPYIQSVYDGQLGSILQVKAATNSGITVTSFSDANGAGISIGSSIATSSAQGVVKPYTSYSGVQSITTATGNVSSTAFSASTAGATINKITTVTGRFYAVTMDSSGHMFVNVPWTDTDTSVTSSYNSGLEIAKFGPSGNQKSLKVPYATNSQYGLVKTGGTLSDSTGYEVVKVDSNGVMYAKNTYTNTWRSVYAWNKTQLGTANDYIDQALGETIGANFLAFSGKFGYTEKTVVVGNNGSDITKTVAEIDLVWAEVDSLGNVTYR